MEEDVGTDDKDCSWSWGWFHGRNFFWLKLMIQLAILSLLFFKNAAESEKDSSVESAKTSTSPVKISSDNLINKPNWSPRDAVQISVVKEALHVSTAQSTVVCREDEQKRIFDFCKACIEEEKAGSLCVDALGLENRCLWR